MKKSSEGFTGSKASETQGDGDLTLSTSQAYRAPAVLGASVKDKRTAPLSESSSLAAGWARAVEQE